MAAQIRMAATPMAEAPATERMLLHMCVRSSGGVKQGEQEPKGLGLGAWGCTGLSVCEQGCLASAEPQMPGMRGECCVVGRVHSRNNCACKERLAFIMHV